MSLCQSEMCSRRKDLTIAITIIGKHARFMRTDVYNFRTIDC
jgi:hypothetical protein